MLYININEIMFLDKTMAKHDHNEPHGVEIRLNLLLVGEFRCMVCKQKLDLLLKQ